MKKKILFIIIATISLTISSCNNSSSHHISVPHEIDLLESTKYRKYDLSKSDIKVLKEYYQTEEGKTHLIELEGKLGDDKVEKLLHKRWVLYIMDYEKNQKKTQEFVSQMREWQINQAVKSLNSNLTQEEAEQILKNKGYNSKMIDTILSSYKKSGGKLKEE